MNRYYKREKVIQTKMSPPENLPENAIKWSAILYETEEPEFKTEEVEFSYRLVYA